MKQFFIILFLTLYTLNADCLLPQNIQPFIEKTSLIKLKRYKDIRRNFKPLKSLCVNIVRFNEGKYKWKMLLVTNPNKEKGAFWFLPHDDENSAFDSAVYATFKYGGGFLAVMANDKRYFMGQDPNRNFGKTSKVAKTCKKQYHKAPKYTKIVFEIIDSFRDKKYPYMALHNNKNGYYGNGGSGGVSILKSSKIVKSYLAYPKITIKDKGLKDEDSLVYIAGMTKKPNRVKLKKLLNNGLNIKYEIISETSNDCSLSNYVILKKKTTNYYNIETQHHDLKTQKIMIDKIMGLI